MVKFTPLLSASLLACATPAFSAPGDPRHHGTRSPKEIKWDSCGDLGTNKTAPLVCGSLAVPLDYTDPDSGKTLNLQLLKIPASSKTPKGSVFFNVGGPGASGIADMVGMGSHLRALIPGSYDIVNVVPRGTGDTLPFSCYKSKDLRAASNTMVPPVTNSSDSALGTFWAGAKNLADACFETQKTTGNLIGTAFTARDIMSVVDVLEDDGKLRYWGVSYGSILGETLVAMFPDRMRRVILDGVWNGHEYYNVDVEQVSDADSAFSGFCAQCVDNRDKCPIAGDHTAAELEDDLYAALDDLKFNPIPLLVGGVGMLVDYGTIKPMIFGDLYFPQKWPQLAQTLDVLVSGNATGVIAALSKAPAPPTADADAILGIKCSDKLFQTESLKEMLPNVEARWELSRIGGDVADGSALQCARWRMLAKERYTGDFQVKPAYPVLLINNQNDPITPLVSAKNMSAGFAESVVLEQTGYGHTSFFQASLCTAKAARAYLEYGMLPDPGTVCEVDAPSFSDDDGWESVLKQLAEDEE